MSRFDAVGLRGLTMQAAFLDPVSTDTLRAPPGIRRRRADASREAVSLPACFAL